MCAGAYQKHLRKEHAYLDIRPASKMRNPPPDYAAGPAASEIDYHELSQRHDSDQKENSVCDPTGYEHNTINDDVQVMYDMDTKVHNNNTWIVVEQRHHPGARRAIAEVQACFEEHHNGSEEAWAPLPSAQRS